MAEYEDLAKRFAADTEHHEMRVLDDHGTYRHLRFQNERGRWFSLTTWPRKLVVNGDAGTFVLSAETEDMFDLIRRSSGSGPNVVYWGEKVIASCVTTFGYSWSLLEARIAKELEKAEPSWPGVAEAWEEHAFGWDSGYSIGFGSEAYRAVREFAYTPEDEERTFRFEFWGDWETNDWHPTWVWCCHAIEWGVRQYLAWRLTVPAHRPDMPTTYEYGGQTWDLTKSYYDDCGEVWENRGWWLGDVPLMWSVDSDGKPLHDPVPFGDAWHGDLQVWRSKP